MSLYSLIKGKSIKYVPTFSTPNAIKALNPLKIKPDKDSDIELLIKEVVDTLNKNETNIVSVVCTVLNGKAHNFLIIKNNNYIAIVDHKLDKKYWINNDEWYRKQNNYRYIIDEISFRIFQKVKIHFIPIDEEIVLYCPLYRQYNELGVNACNIYVDNWIAKHIHNQMAMSMSS